MAMMSAMLLCVEYAMCLHCVGHVAVCRVRNVSSLCELQDVYQQFLLYYGNDVPKMKLAARAARKKQQELQRQEHGGEEQDQEDEQEDDQTMLKQASRKTGYTMCIEAGLGTGLGTRLVIDWVLDWS